MLEQCPVCAQAGPLVFIELDGLPAHCNILWPSREAAVAAPRGAIRLAFCCACGMVFNACFDPGLMRYSREYENSLHFSPRFQEYARQLATELIARYDLHDKDIVEIGSGSGEFLTLLCSLGPNRGVGFDPSYKGESQHDGIGGNPTFIRDFYSRAYADVPADFVCCRHVLEHLAEPRAFVRELRSALGERPGAALFFEVPNALATLRDLGIWDVIYEHCSYFTAPSLTRLFAEAGFTVVATYPAFDGQFLCLEAMPASADTPYSRPPDVDDLSGLAAAFGEHYRAGVQAWQQHLERWRADGRRVVVWGAGSKGVTFLNAVPAARGIDYVVDLNVRKHGMYVAGAGQQIVPPSFLRDYHPDVIIVMNPIYVEEIRAMVVALGVTAEVVVSDERAA